MVGVNRLNIHIYLHIVLVILCFASPYDIEYIRYQTMDHSDSGTSGTVKFTLWYGTTIYYDELDSPNSDREYYSFMNKTTPDVSILGTRTTNCPFQPRVLVEQCDNGNAVFIDGISFKTTSGLWYGVSQICRSTEQTDDYRLRNDVGVVCPEGYPYHYDCIGVDAEEPKGFDPCTQLIYFDLTRPNEFLLNAIMVDGTDSDPYATVDTTCNPTDNPSPSPTNPSISPTKNPINNPTQSPTKTLTAFPTTVSTMVPTMLLSTVCTVFTSQDMDVEARNDEGDALVTFSLFFGILSAVLCVILIIGSAYICTNLYTQAQETNDGGEHMIYNSEHFYAALLVAQWC
eukprot:282544_1